MTSILHTTGILPHYQKEYSFPDLSGDMLQIYDKVQGEVSELQFSSDPDDEQEFDKQICRVENELIELQSLAKSTDIEDLRRHVENLENLVFGLSQAIINIGEIAKIASDKLPDNTEDIEEALQNICYEGSSALGCECNLGNALEERGWNLFQKTFVYRVIGGEFPRLIQLNALFGNSQGDNIALGIDGWFCLRGKELAFCCGDDVLILNAYKPGVEITTKLNGKSTKFHTRELEDIFMDIFDPTEDEILMYEMTSGKRYDILSWRNIFGKKRKPVA
ncbi:hypothetical protein [Escherichia coli]|uniref:hypothetical protein n=1 Tax=Escherichia coli TaxID=562 RepID=UPI000CFD4442|nr:hypothetical protein [Escherichia coli]UDW09861.1 hypothetical protein [Escherichia phage 18-1-2]UJQ87404.1 hypothetical protein [Escherichia phage 24-2-1]UJQ87528.1 hypothetical protein [Escherichia phage 19-1-2]UOX40121.1 hypothetical protein [Escherichia phage vB_EcoM_TH18]